MNAQFDKRPAGAYAEIRRLAELTVNDLKERIAHAVGALGDPYLVRARMDEPRIKSHQSLARKARQKGWSFQKTLSKVQDIVGFRLICNNLQDVYRAADLLEESLKNDGLTVRRDDCIAKPRPSGYRAIHLLFPMHVRMGKNEATLGCEIQIRSEFQDSWARLSRFDVYSSDVPKSIEKRMAALAKLLARADETAENIRIQVSRPRRGQRPTSRQSLTDSAIAFLYRDTFGEDPPDYFVRYLSRETEGLGLRSDAVHVALTDAALIDRIKSAYREAAGWEAEPTEVFSLAVRSVSLGKGGVLRRAASEGRAARREIESIARREMLSDLPAVDDMLASLEYRQKDEDTESQIERWACALGVSSSCVICGTTIVDPDEYATAAVKHYSVRGRRAESIRERIVEAVSSTAIETGSWEDPAICNYCANRLTKD